MKPVRPPQNPMLHVAAFSLLSLHLLLACPGRLSAADATDVTVASSFDTATPEGAVINPLTAVRQAPMLTFSTQPKLAEITQCRLLAEPLLPMGRGPAASSAEIVALAQALLSFNANPTHEDMTALEGFLNTYPQSSFRVALLTDLGILYRSHGYWTKALEAWQSAWQAGQSETDPTKRLIVDRALAQLAELTARLGRVADLQALLRDNSGRSMHGPAAEKFAGAKTSLFLMQHEPTKSFRCGPLAVGSILRILSPGQAPRREVHESVSTDHGTSLVMVEAFARRMGLDYQIAFRNSGAEVIVPSVVNWKVGHYAALTKEVNGSYLVQDPTFTDDFVVSSQALDEEASGYFLVRAGALPPGWRKVREEEGSEVWGKGSAPPNTPPPPPCQGPSIKPECKCCKNPGMADYDVDQSRVNVSLTDTPLFYTPPRGPSIDFTATYSQRDVAFSAVPNYPNLGAQWNFGWVAFIVDDPNNVTAQSYGPGGGQLNYSGASGNTGTYAPQALTQAVLQRTSPTSYVKTFPDGSRQVYGLADTSTPARIFLTEYDDPAGNKLTYTYDPVHFRLLSVSDALGQVTTLSYVSDDSTVTNGDYYRVSKVTDPFGRNASFAYNFQGQLIQITDMAGMASQFTYDLSNVITKLTTPYGDTTFAVNDVDSDRSLLITDPMGGQEKVEFKYSMVPPDDGAAVPVAAGLYTEADYNAYRTSYYWDKKAYGVAPGDYSKAHLYHYVHTSDINSMSDILESEKPALESRIYYNYLGQTNAYVTSNSNLRTKAARVLDDGSTQLAQYDYNAQGKMVVAVTPANADTPARTTTYKYAVNGIDLVAVYQQNPMGASVDGYGMAADLVGSMTYDSQGKHLMVSSKDTAGQSTVFTYNSFGQLLTAINANNESTTFTYDRDQDNDGKTDGYLKTITGAAAGATITIAYDSFGRVSRVTDSEGYNITIGYDALAGNATKTLNRVAKRTYPDGTYEEIDYDRLEPQWTRDRLGRWTQFFHDDMRRMTKVVDPLGHATQYGWCSCGALESIIDAAGNQTTWMRDVESRVINEVYPDTKITTRTYEATTSRTKSITDAKSQRINYAYNIDDTLRQLSYTDTGGNALVPPTTGVSYTYETVYGRLSTMVDGIGTTQYFYNPIVAAPMLGAGSVASVDGPFANDTITFSYDALGRVVGQAVNGSLNSTVFGYDSLGRVHTVNNALGAFTYNFARNTGRLDKLVYPSGQTSQYSYFDGTNDPRLQTLKNVTSSASLLSQFDYTYNTVGDILTWSQNNPSLPHTRQFAFGYDADDELASAILQDTITGSVLRAQAYQYDTAMNRVAVQDSGNVSTESCNNLNQLTSTNGGGLMRFAGTVSKPSTITVGGNSATVRADGSYEGWAQVASTGTTRVHVVATDGSGNVTDKYADITPSTVTVQSFGYDANGNQTAAGPNSALVTYGWNAAGWLVTITQGNNVTHFDYDGQGRRVRESFNGAEVRHWVWIGSNVAEERDATNNVVRRFFAQGEQISGQPYFYTRDHLGSIRELTDGTQTTRARYDYDLYGVRTANQITANPVEASFGYTGHYYHAASGLCLALHRAYNAQIGRWISRDPVGESGGINLYGYVGNSPLTQIDPLGYTGAAVTSTVTVDGPGVARIGGLTTAAEDAAAVEAVGAGGGAVTVAGAVVLPALALAAWTPQGQNWIAHNIVDPWLDIIQPLPSAMMPPPQKPPGGPPNTSADCPNSPNGDNEHNARGREAHKWWQPPEGYDKEFTFDNGLRADAINFQTRSIIELKPNNPNAIARGEQQLQNYIRQAEKQFGGKWSGCVVTY